jgi:hypothetical protein
VIDACKEMQQQWHATTEKLTTIFFAKISGRFFPYTRPDSDDERLA